MLQEKKTQQQQKLAWQNLKSSEKKEKERKGTRTGYVNEGDMSAKLDCTTTLKETLILKHTCRQS